MDELTGELYPLVIEQLKAELKRVIIEHITFVINKRTNKPNVGSASLLSSVLPKEVKLLDTQLYKLAKSLDTLTYINPINLKHEKKEFLKKPHQYSPEFKYKQLDVDPYLFKEHLYRLPVDDVRDADIQFLYRKVIDQLAKRIDLLTSIGTEEFLYNSLRYYGQPSDNDIKNAKFLLHARVYDEEQGKLLTSEEVIKAFQDSADEYGIKCKILTSNKIVAGALVSGKTLKINASKQFEEKELKGLIEHELGVHIVTSANAELQPLKILKLGLPGNTHTQEGLAILSEHLSGNFSLNRLQTLALRVVAVNMMVHGADFRDTYFDLVDNYKIDVNSAFTITARVYRGRFYKRLSIS